MPNAIPTGATCRQPDRDEDLLTALRTEAYANGQLQALAGYFDAASNETRLRMLYVLHQAGELCVCDLADIFEISQPAVSRHLKILREKELLKTRRDAQTIYHTLETSNPFARILGTFFDTEDTEPIALSITQNQNGT